jgi:Flp pilus assembly protein TadG
MSEDKSMHAQRGQALPLSLFGIIAMLIFAYFALDFGNGVRWQMRAQNAADSAAQAVLSLQTEDFNQMTAMLYATAVEEFRIRRLLNDIVLTEYNAGGCAGNPAATPGTDVPACDVLFLSLRNDYDKAVARYTQDIVTLNQITQTLNYANVSTDSTTLLKQIQNDCSGQAGGDCNFKYRISLGTRDSTQAVEMDALGILKPSLGRLTGPSGVNPLLFAPLKVEVDVCTTVQPMLPAFFAYQPKPYYAIGRGAATAVMMEQDWMQPGTIINPFANGQPFQPAETYVTGISHSDGYDWYNLNFGGNATTANATQNFYRAGLFTDEFSAQLGWWSSIPIHPWTGAQSDTALGCS